MENNIIEVSPSRFAILATEGDHLEDKPDKDDTIALDEVEEGEIEIKHSLNKMGSEMKEQQGVRPSLPRGSKSVTRNGTKASSQASKDKNPGVWKRKAPKKKN